MSLRGFGPSASMLIPSRIKPSNCLSRLREDCRAPSITFGDRTTEHPGVFYLDITSLDVKIVHQLFINTIQIVLWLNCFISKRLPEKHAPSRSKLPELSSIPSAAPSPPSRSIPSTSGPRNCQDSMATCSTPSTPLFMGSPIPTD